MGCWNLKTLTGKTVVAPAEGVEHGPHGAREDLLGQRELVGQVQDGAEERVGMAVNVLNMENIVVTAGE